MPLAFGALREGDIRLCAEGKVTRISLSSNLYWSMIGPVLVTRRTSIGQRAKQYCLLLVTSTGQLIDQYWSHHPFSECGVKRMYMRGLCVMLCAGRLGAELVVFSGGGLGGVAISSAP